MSDKIENSALINYATKLFLEEVNHPDHYNVGKIEVIDAIEDWQLGFNLGNAVKYIARAKSKGKEETDIRKAIWYLQRHLGENKKPVVAVEKEPKPRADTAPNRLLAKIEDLCGRCVFDVGDLDYRELILEIEKLIKEEKKGY